MNPNYVPTYLDCEDCGQKFEAEGEMTLCEACAFDAWIADGGDEGDPE